MLFGTPKWASRGHDMHGRPMVKVALRQIRVLSLWVKGM